jgi:hypothetical protein
MKTRWFILFILPVLILTACGQGSDISPMEPQIPPPPEVRTSPPENPSPNSTKPVEVSPLYTSTPDPSTQEDDIPMPKPSDPAIQALIETATKDLAQRLSIPAEQIQPKQVSEMVWPDSSLGCPNPSSSYLQVLTPGYLIRLQALDRTYEYHTDKKDSVIYCENPSPLSLDSLPSE